MSLFGDYIAEREGKSIVETPNGFATFCFLPEGVYLEDVYVRPEARKSGEGRYLISKVAEIAREKGVLNMITSVKPSAKGSTSSVKATLACGFELHSSGADYILFRRGL